MKNLMTSSANTGGSKMKKICALTIAGVMAWVPLAGMAEISGNIGAASNYVFRGVSLTDDGAQISGGLDYAHESGFYAGTWLSNIDSSYEVDLYAGFGNDIGGGFSYDVGYLLYAYPELNDSNYGEIYGSLSYEWITAGVAYTINSEVNETAAGADTFVEGDIYYYVSASYPLQNDWSVGATVGWYDFDDDGVAGADASYTHAQLDVTKSTDNFGEFTFSVSWAEDAPATGGTGDVLPFVSWSKSF